MYSDTNVHTNTHIIVHREGGRGRGERKGGEEGVTVLQKPMISILYNAYKQVLNS